MKFALCGVLCVGLFVVCDGAHSSKSIPRILDGKSVDISSYPYQVSMRILVGYGRSQHFCGGSIVSERHIVTAAHCVEGKLNNMQYIRIFTGTSRSDRGGQSHSVSRIAMHPGYSGEPPYFNDIAVVTLSKPIVFSSTQRPIALPTRNIENGAAATITGWGDTSAVRSATPIYLQQAPMTLIDTQNCRTILSGVPLKNTQVCALSRAGTGVCSGDSGGPLVSNGQLVGVASFVVMKCGGSYPDIYTNVYSFLDFIEETINSDTPSQKNGQEQKHDDGKSEDNGQWSINGIWQKFLQFLKQLG